ncbi:MAG: alpha/beta hydrolase [Gemmatimonadaceae bacterium]|nr:alpha/beta hydrolase [Gemmatimonadaceae bacterium]
MPRPPVIATPEFQPIPPVTRRLPSTRSVLPYAPQDADYVRLPVGPGALHAMRYGHGGPTVLLVHGFTTSAPLWQKVAPILLARGCQVIVPDLLGFGESDRPVGGPYAVSAQARYLDRALALLRISRVVAVGQDLGCVVLRRLAAVRPDRVDAMIFCSPTPGDAPRGPEIDAVRGQTGPALLEISSRPLGVVDLLGPVLRAAVSQGESMPDSLVARFSAPYTGSQGARHLLDLARAVAEEEEGDQQPISDSGPLRVTGKDDPMVLGANASMLRLDGALRLLPLERPEPLAALIMNSIVPALDSSVSLEERGVPG